MIDTNKKSQDLMDSSIEMQMQGACILEMGVRGELEIIFQNGIDLSLVYKIINSIRSKILNNEEGTIKNFIGTLNIYLLYCSVMQFKKCIAFFVYKEEISIDYSKLDNFTENLFRRIGIDTNNIEIRRIIIKSEQLHRVKGLIGFLALDKTGLLYFSRVKKGRKKISRK